MSDKSTQKKSEINWEDAIKVTVEMVQHEDSWYSRHQPSSEEDYESLMALPTGGMTQVAHTLLIEAIKREVYLSFYSLGSKDGLDHKVYQVLNEIIKREIPNVVANLTVERSQNSNVSV